MDLPPDVVRYVEINYPHSSQSRIRDYLDDLGTPRLQRAVLYLGNGSFSMFEHYAAAAASDIREIVVAAEYETQISEMPIPIRDMSKPFHHEDNLGTAMRRGPRQMGSCHSRYHEELMGERFELGEARYVVMWEQPSASHVYLRRFKDNRSRVVQLPRVFVIEQLAEAVEMTAQVTFLQAASTPPRAEGA